MITSMFSKSFHKGNIGIQLFTEIKLTTELKLQDNTFFSPQTRIYNFTVFHVTLADADPYTRLFMFMFSSASVKMFVEILQRIDQTMVYWLYYIIELRSCSYIIT